MSGCGLDSCESRAGFSVSLCEHGGQLRLHKRRGMSILTGPLQLLLVASQEPHCSGLT
jgi:hypothetical protein